VYDPFQFERTNNLKPYMVRAVSYMSQVDKYFEKYEDALDYFSEQKVLTTLFKDGMLVTDKAKETV